MILSINPDLNLVVEQPLSRLPLAVVKLPRGPKVPIWVQFARDGAVIDPSEALTSGALVVGLYYKITTFVTGDSFTNVGAASNATSVYFLCTGTTPTTWTNSSTLQQCDSAGVLFSLIFSVKKNGEYDGAVLVLASGTDFTKFGTGTSTIFKSKCSFSTAEINTLLGVDASVANDESEVTLMGEVSWLGPDESKAFPFQIDLQNDSYKVNDVVTSTPGVQAMSLVTTSSEALLTGSRVITGSGTVTVTLTTGLVTLSVPSELVVPSQTGNSGKYLTTNGTATSWGTVIPVSDGDKGDITVSNSGATWTIDNDAVTLAKLAHMATARVVGRTTAGTGTPELLTISGTGSVAMTTSPTFVTPDLGTPSALVGTNISGTAASLTAGLVSSIGSLTGDVTSSNRATTLATVNANVGSFTNASLTVNAKGLVTAASSGTSAVTSITGTANEITVTGTTTPTLSLPSALTFTAKTVTGGTFNSGAFNGTVGATTPATVAGTTGTFSGEIATTGGTAYIYTTGTNAQIYTFGTNAHIYTFGAGSYIATFGSGGYIQTRDTFKLNNGAFMTTLSHAPSADRAIALPDAAGTLLLSNGSGANLTGTAASLTAGNVTTNANLTGHVTSVGNAAVLGSFTMAQLSTAVSDGDPAYVGAANTFTTGQTISSTTSLLLGTAGSAVGNVGFKNATSGTTTLAPATGALGTGTVTLPLTGTLATLEGANTFTGANVNSTAGAASLPAMRFSGVPFAGTGTTSFPLFYINDPNATASTTLSTAGTYFGVNGDGTQDLMNLLRDGVLVLRVLGAGGMVVNGSISAGGNPSTLGLGGYSGSDVVLNTRMRYGTQTNTVAYIEAQGTGEHLRLQYSSTQFVSFTVGSTGTLTLGGTGTNNGLALSGTLAVTGASTLTGGADITTSITTPSTTFAIANTTATTLNIGGAATTLNIGATTCATVLGGTLYTSSTTIGGRAVQTSDKLVLSTGATGQTDRTAIRWSQGGYAASVGTGPSAANSDAAGDKLVFTNQAGGKTSVGSGGDYDLWLQGRSGGVICRFFDGTAQSVLIGPTNTASTNTSTGAMVILAAGGIGVGGNGNFGGTLAVTGATTLTAALITTPEALAPALNAGAACGVTTVASGFALNGVNALTLANGTNGQIKTIVCTAVTAAGTATLTPTTCTGYTTVAFTAAGQTLTLQYFTTGGWVILSVRGATPA